MLETSRRPLRRRASQAERLGFSQQLQELIAVDSGGFNDLVEGALRQVSAMQRNDNTMAVIWMTKDVVTSLDAIEAPAAPLQHADRLTRCDGREPRRQAPTVTRSISIGPGIGSPWASSDSR